MLLCSAQRRSVVPDVSVSCGCEIYLLRGKFGSERWCWELLKMLGGGVQRREMRWCMF